MRALLAVLCLGVMITGCGVGGNSESDKNVNENEHLADNPHALESVDAIAETEDEKTGFGETDEERSARMEAYQFALQQISFEHVYPDGTDTGFDGWKWSCWQTDYV